MSTSTLAARRLRRNVLLPGTRVLLGLFGTVRLAAAVWFSFFASAEQGGEPQGAGDWFVAGWSALLAAGYLDVAARLSADGRRVLPLAAALAATDVPFSLVKLVVYDEPEAAGFLAATLVLFGLVVAATRPRRH